MESFSEASHIFLPPSFYSLEKSYGLVSPSISKNTQVVIICSSLESKDAVMDLFGLCTSIDWSDLLLISGKALCAVKSMGELSHRHKGGWLCSALNAGRVNNIIF